MQIVPDGDKKEEPALPVPRWLIAIPVIGALVAAVIIAGSGPGPLALAIFFICLFVVSYLYVYMLGVWRARAAKRKGHSP